MTAPLTRLRGRKPITITTIVGLLLVPLTVAGVLLWGLWKPTERLPDMQAAVVNLDEPVEVDGQLVPIGRVLAGELIGGDADTNFTWILTDEEDAEAGLDDGRYATVVTIPEDFSAAATSMSGGPADVEQATIDVTETERGRLIDTALSSIVTQTATRVLNEQLGAQFVGTVFVGMGEMQRGISTAASGATQLATGTTELATGTRELATGTTELAAGTSELASGTSELAAGASELSTGTSELASGTSELAGGVSELAGGASQLAGGASDLAGGASQLAGGASDLAGGASGLATGVTQLSGGISAYADGTDDYAAGMSAYADGSQQLADGVTEYTGSVNQIVTGVLDVSGPAITELEAFRAALDDPDQYPMLPDDIRQSLKDELDTLIPQLYETTGGLEQLHGAGEALAAGAQASAAGARELSVGANDLSAGARGLAGGASELAGGAASLADGASGLASGASGLASGAGQLAGGVGELSAGTSALSDGAGQLASGAGQLAAGTSELAAGTSELATGTSELAEGTSELATGTTELADGTTELATGTTELADGLQEAAAGIPSYSESESERMAEAAITPVVAKGGSDDIFSGAGLPFFTGIALWAGALASFLILAPLWRRTREAARGTVGITLRSAWPAVALGAAQGALAGIVMPITLGYTLSQGMAFLGLSVLAGITFMLFVQGLSALLGGIGRFIAFALLVIGFTIGVVSTVPGALTAIGDASPIGAAFSGFQTIAAGGGGGGSALALILWALAGLVLTGFAVQRARRPRG